jgi:hypothetical protein
MIEIWTESTIPAAKLLVADSKIYRKYGHASRRGCSSVDIDNAEADCHEEDEASNCPYPRRPDNIL